MAETTTKKKEAINSYNYKLYLGSSIEDPTKTVTSLSLIPEEGEQVKIDSTNYTITLQGVKFTRKIYEPGLIERGYEHLEEKLRNLGADIRREPV